MESTLLKKYNQMLDNLAESHGKPVSAAMSDNSVYT